MSQEIILKDKLEIFKRMMFTYISEELADDFVFASEVNVTAFEHWAERLIGVHLRMDIYGHQGEHLVYRYPRGWWQTLKAQFAPAWFLDRFPVETVELVIKTKLLYPKGTEEKPIIWMSVYRDGHEVWLEGMKKDESKTQL